MKEMEELVHIYRYLGEGLEISYKNSEWITGVKNYKPASDVCQMDRLERHLLTDELFVPLTEGSLIITKAQDAQTELQIMKMEVGCIYAVKQGAWHNAVMREGGKIVLVERPGTGMENSEFCQLSAEERASLLSFERER